MAATMDISMKFALARATALWLTGPAAPELFIATYAPPPVATRARAPPATRELALSRSMPPRLLWSADASGPASPSPAPPDCPLTRSDLQIDAASVAACRPERMERAAGVESESASPPVDHHSGAPA